MRNRNAVTTTVTTMSRAAKTSRQPLVGALPRPEQLTAHLPEIEYDMTLGLDEREC